MATLERIRQRSGLLIIVIGLAMLAFILTDLLSSGGSFLRGSADVVGRVDGTPIKYTEFNTRMDKLETQIRTQNPQQAQFITRKQLADGVWDEFLRDNVLGEQYADLGFTVTSGELYERTKQNPNVQSAEIFRDEMTGGFSDAKLSQYINNLKSQSGTNEQAAEAYRGWVDFEQAIKKNALSTKYNVAVEKGLYIPAAMAKASYAEANTNSTIQYISLSYSSISDSAISVSDGDLKSYYNDHKKDYESDDMADISYVSFEVGASDADKNEIREELEKFNAPQLIGADSVPSFANTTSDSSYAAERSDVAIGNRYIRKEGISPALDSNFFDQSKGYVYGPYEEGNYYKLSKITDVKTLPDSVSARHILISFAGANNGQSQSQRNFEDAKALADSLLGIVKADSTKFGALAQQYSEDPGSGSKGGYLGWFADGAMVPTFNNYCFQNDKGDMGVVFSQFGYHIIHILNQKGFNRAIRVTTIAREINPSDETLDGIYTEAGKFASEATGDKDFNTLAEEKGYRPRPVTGVGLFDENISGIGQNREIVQWMFKDETEVGDIQLFNNNNNSYIVAKLTGRSQDGYSSFESVKEEIRAAVIKKKKAEQLMKKVKDAQNSAGDDINALATALSTQSKAQGVNINTSVLTGAGREPKVMGVASGLDVNAMSKPIEGNLGVYVVKVTNRTDADVLPDYSGEQQRLASTIRPQVGSKLFSTLKDNSHVEDLRAKFY